MFTEHWTGYSWSRIRLCLASAVHHCAVYSIGVRYIPAIPRTVQNWCLSQQPPWPVYRAEGGRQASVEEFIALLQGQAFKALSRNVFKNRQRTSTSSGILKAEAVFRFARVLSDFGISLLGDTEDQTKNERVEEVIRKIPGQRSGISFSYFLMLAGSDNFVKADRMLCRFVAEAIGAPRPVSSKTAETLVLAASSHLKQEFPDLTPRLLDHAIWNYQRQTRAKQRCSE